MFRNATALRLVRAERRTVAVSLHDESGVYSRVKPARRPARRNVDQAAIHASALGLTV